MPNTNNVNINESLFHIDGKPSIGKSFPIAVQHLLAMIIGNTLPALVLTNAVKGTQFEIPSGDAIYIIQAGMFIAAIATFLQLYPVLKVGAKLPVIMGVSFAYIPILIQIGTTYGYGAVFGAQIIGGVVAFIVGILIGKIRKYFPPIVSGTVVLTIGLSLYPVAIGYMAGGNGNPMYGSKYQWIVAIITLITVLICNMFGKGLIKLAAILIGIIVGYVLSIIINSTVAPGFVNFSNIQNADFFTYPRLLLFKPEFPVGAVITMAIMYIVNSVQAVGDISSTTVGGLDREATDEEISGGIKCNGVASIIGGFIGALPTATYSQNVGIVSMTKVVARKVLAVTAVLIAIAGFIPKFGGLMMSIPQCVIGGATISVFAQITMNGIKLITSEELSIRNSTVVGLGLALGMGITSVPAATEAMDPTLKMIFTSSPVVIATLVVFFLNIILPEKTIEQERKEREEMDRQ
ncbi:MAG: nucleobase:cation symporter-2 family protein [Tissierellia bacterium]|nr:nucleobase:cation symporter-2 family protein [Tissierellia bacterium]